MAKRLEEYTAFFSLCSRVRVRDAAASGFKGEDTAGVLSFSSFGIAVGAGLADCCAISVILGLCKGPAFVVRSPTTNRRETQSAPLGTLLISGSIKANQELPGRVLRLCGDVLIG